MTPGNFNKKAVSKRWHFGAKSDNPHRHKTLKKQTINSDFLQNKITKSEI